MENFDALVQLLEGVDGIARCDENRLADVLKEMLDNPCWLMPSLPAPRWR
ncbi:MAG: hypothetical protein ACLT38_09585 [Akkermansia sp.]